MSGRPPLIKWDQHVLLILSVLAGLAFTRTFDLLKDFKYSAVAGILTVVVLYVVLDNWYTLHSDLAIFDIDRPSEAILSVLAVIAYSCLPFLYGAAPGNTALGLSPPEWMIGNFVLICILDSLRKIVTVVKFNNPTEPVDEIRLQLLGAYVFYIVTGVLYAVTLCGLLMIIRLSNWPEPTKALIVMCAWLVVRTSDKLIIPKISIFAANAFFPHRSELESGE